MMGKMPKHFNLIYKVAKKYNLSYPFGRAIYTINRGQNCGWTGLLFSSDRYWNGEFWETKLNPTTKEILRFLKTIKSETAMRWAHHWNNGGSVKSLGKKRVKK